MRLGLRATRKEAQAQHAFRGLMRKLHPDRVGADLPGAAEAIEMLQARHLSAQNHAV